MMNNGTESIEQPPFYILVSHSAHATTSSAPTTTLSHPIIEYHYANEGSPHDLLPRTPGEQVLILDYEPSQIANIFSRSVAGNTAVTGVKVTDAPGAGGADVVDPSRNNKMYIIETMALQEDKSAADAMSPQTALARFKQRNAVIRQVLDYGEPGVQLPGSSTAGVVPGFNGTDWPLRQSNSAS
ncbi:uncharacterized protein STEHIDRAFT_107243 [Stereum hirsutum FP-91666 SS1]|uniref:uncharacterized protein n=1 Tax=Stereum hirsutum (strain FP-91666) TaxID=721885 RepID=UPI000440A55F|nr:uncharacterized protein STEHIDRAFT_107243 [Stereum hirsutum FP-91666 SS1]EIM92859.1 hypothetical protein STEHIDRAFT_107243 [Stereum hirsutum FP-91666 SS1]